MASDTAPTAVPGPDGQPHTGTPQAVDTPQPGGLAGLLSAVEPARPAAFTLHPTTDGTDQAGHDQTAAAGPASDFYHPDSKDPHNTAKTSTSGKQERGVVRAWMLAGADRWKKGGDARLKRLDIQKARAQARQVKEQVTVNRAEKIVGGSTNSSTGSTTNAGKSLNSKSSGGGSAGSKGGHKNASGSGRGGSGGGSGSTGRGGGSGRGTGGGAGRGSGGTNSGSGGSGGGRGPGGGKKDSGHNTPSGKGNGGGSKTDKASNSTSGSAGKPGKDGSVGPTGKKSSGGPSTEHTTARETPLQRSPRKHSLDKAGKDTPSPKNTAGPAGKGGDKASLDKTPKNGSEKTQPGTPTDPKKPSGPDKPAPPASDTSKKTPAVDPKKTKTAPAPAPGPGTRVNTQPSREAGYRDGTRAARAAVHAEAWRDGVRDGWTDTKQAAGREKQRLDQAHQDRKKAREDKPVTAPTSADFHPPAAPTQPPAQAGQATAIPVTNTDATHIQLGDGAARQYMSRGEVRTLKSFQTRLDGKADTMTRVAEATRALKAHADEQAKKVTQLREQAKAVHGGDKLSTALTRLEEAAKAQAGKAEEIYKRAVRAAEACKALNANTETRYGGIYKAVADAGQTAPATMTYYKESANA